jgi:cell division protein FtsW (lipid II flippase)
MSAGDKEKTDAKFPFNALCTQTVQLTYNVILTHVCVNVVTLERQRVFHILCLCVCVCLCVSVCSLMYSVRNAHALC